MSHRQHSHPPLSNQKLYKGALLLWPLALLLLAGLACNFPKLRTPEKATLSMKEAVGGPALEASDASQESQAMEAAGSLESEANELILHWQGSLPGDAGTCHNLEVSAGHQAHYGLCGGALATAPFNPPQWDELVLRTAPFQANTSDSSVTFNGQGALSGPAWERAVLNLAQDAYNALVSGQACAACSTVLNWSFSDGLGTPTQGTCQNLWVLDYGYAYLGEAPCAGGQAVIKAQGWLETGEWAQLDAWLTGRAEVHLGERGASYLLGSGSHAMSADELIQLADWAQQVRRRLAP